jgi:hypothetical protein
MLARIPPRTSLRAARHPRTIVMAGTVLLLAVLVDGGSLLTAHVAGVLAGAAPFVLETETYSFAKIPSGQRVARMTEARRSDGTRATLTTSFISGGGRMTLRTIQYPDGRKLQLVDAIFAKTTWPAPAAGDPAALRARELRLAHHSCAEKWEALLRFEVLFGVRFAVVKTIPVDVFGTTSWRSPELGCETLQYETETVRAGRAVVLTKQRLVSFAWAEPGSKLFDAGAHYTELRPSELLRKQAGAEGGLWNADLAKLAAAEDAMYLKLRGLAPAARH